MKPAEEAISLLVRSINAWLAATGQTSRVEARDITVTRLRDNTGRPAFILAFREKELPGRPYSNMRPL